MKREAVFNGQRALYDTDTGMFAIIPQDANVMTTITGETFVAGLLELEWLLPDSRYDRLVVIQQISSSRSQ
jgi:hypothetical protein